MITLTRLEELITTGALDLVEPSPTAAFRFLENAEDYHRLILDLRCGAIYAHPSQLFALAFEGYDHVVQSVLAFNHVRLAGRGRELAFARVGVNLGLSAEECEIVMFQHCRRTGFFRGGARRETTEADADAMVGILTKCLAPR